MLSLRFFVLVFKVEGEEEEQAGAEVAQLECQEIDTPRLYRRC